MARSKVVVAGAPQSGKATLVAGLETLLLAAAAGGGGGEPPAAAAGGEGGALRLWTLATKYYDAALEVHVVPAEEWEAPAARAEAALAGAEALVLVLDATAHGSLSGVDAWAARAADASVGTLLCVTNKVDVATGRAPGDEEEPAAAELLLPAPGADARHQQHAAFVGRVAEWALEAGFEHVQAAAVSPAAGGAGRDKAGVPRVLEALQCTMWSSMRRRETPPPPPPAAAAASREEAAAAPLTAGDASPGEGGAATTAAAPPTAAAPASSDDEEQRLRGLVRGARGVRPPRAAGDGSSGEVGGQREDGDAAEEEEGEDRDDIERLMAEMQRVRDAAHGPGGLSDEQRREAAARVALQLFALMGEGEGEDTDDELEG